jgi:ABC-type transport system involved in cytochrome c biogenesis permease subunit
MYQHRLLKGRKDIAASKKLPSLSALNKYSRQPILFGFPFLMVGMLIGIIMTVEGEYSPWYAAPRIIVVITLWVLYAFYLIQVYRSGVSAKTSSAIAVAGGLLTVVLLVIMGLAPMFS